MIKSNATAIMQNLLFKNPLIDWLRNDGEINVLIVGAGTYGQKFLDLCLQVGQIPNYKLNIKVISQNAEYDMQDYLKLRPSLKEFVAFNGNLFDNDNKAIKVEDFNEEIYGFVNFETIRFPNNDIEINNIMNDFIKEYHYIFIALGNDELNKNVATTFVETTEFLGERCSINFVVENKEIMECSGANVVMINEELTTVSISPDLERMAFNTHLPWFNSMNFDMKKELNKFNAEDEESRYNKESSLSFALAIRYKLRSIGIDDSDLNFERLAKEFSAKIEDESNNDILLKMIAYEHRRWVVEKLTDIGKTSDGLRSWKKLTNYESCIERGAVKDKNNRLHPCIVRGGVDLVLQSQAYNENNHKLWDNSEIDNKLDELDKMSIELHQMFMRHAVNLRKQENPLKNPNGAMSKIEKIVFSGNYYSAQTAFKRFKLCLENVLVGSYGYSKQYNHYETIFKETLKELTDSQQKEIDQHLANTRHQFFPAIEYNLYRDYKYIDVALINKIPFILTYIPQQNLAMAFDDGRLQNGRNEEIFKNIASAMIINPAKIFYLYYFDGTIKSHFLIHKLKSVLNYMRSRNMNVEINFILEINSQIINETTIQQLENAFKKLSVNYCLIKCENEQTSVDNIIDKLSNFNINLFDGSTTMFISHLLQGKFTASIINRHFPYFEFDSKNKVFSNCQGCSYLKYIEDNSFIRIDDMFALNNAVNNKFTFPEFTTIDKSFWKLWNDIYNNNADPNRFNGAERRSWSIRNWNNLCRQLENYSKENDRSEIEFDRNLRVINFKFDIPKNGDNRIFVYRILEMLNNINIISELNGSYDSYINFHYNSLKAKKLLTKAGEILELYTYFKVLETGYFDDAACSYEFRWQMGGVKNEVDCILVKGFHTIIIECKSTRELEQDFYHKLNSIANKFGINCTKVLIANTYDDANRNDVKRLNDLQRQRGVQMNIETISIIDENIGWKLQEIMSKKL